MKIILPFVSFFAAFGLSAQPIVFPDPLFKAKLLEADVSNNIAKDVNNNSIKIDANSDGEIDQAEALLVYQLFYTPGPPPRPANVPGQNTVAHSLASFGFTDLTGISYFTKLRKLDVSNNLLTSLDLTGINYLEYLDCSNNELVAVTVSGLVNLTYFECSYNNITDLYLGSLYNLANLYCDNNQLEMLDVTNLTHLVRIGADSNQISMLQIGNNDNLQEIYCSYNQLTEIDLSDSAAIVLYCNDNPNLVTINLKNGVDSTFDFEMPPVPFPINSFGLSNLPLLANICCDPNEVTVMQQVLSGQPGVGIATDCTPSVVFIPDVNLKNKLLNTNCASFTEGVPSDSYTSSVDTNGDGEIQISEAIAVKGLKINTSIMTTIGDILSVEGLQYFTNLQRLNCNGNQLQSLDVTMMADLVELNCAYNHLTSVDFSGLSLLDLVRCYHNSIVAMPLDGLPMLRFLQASQNSLGQLDVTMLPSLEALLCDSNGLTALEIHDMPTLVEVEAYNNLLSSIDLDGLTELRYLGIQNNLFTTFDLSPLPGLQFLDISSNAISEIDLNGYTNLSQLKISNTLVSQIDCSQSGIRYLSCSFNPNLTSINLKNGVISQTDEGMLDFAFVFSELPLLSSICIDDNQAERYSVAVTDYNATGNVTVYTGEDCLTEVVMSTASFDLKTIVIYPNPASDKLTIESVSAAPIQSAVICNSLGQKIVDISNAAPIQTIDVSSLSAGTYFLKVVSGNGQQTQKFIKM